MARRSRIIWSIWSVPTEEPQEKNGDHETGNWSVTRAIDSRKWTQRSAVAAFESTTNWQCNKKKKSVPIMVTSLDRYSLMWIDLSAYHTAEINKPVRVLSLCLGYLTPARHGGCHNNNNNDTDLGYISHQQRCLLLSTVQKKKKPKKKGGVVNYHLYETSTEQKVAAVCGFQPLWLNSQSKQSHWFGLKNQYDVVVPGRCMSVCSGW